MTKNNRTNNTVTRRIVAAAAGLLVTAFGFTPVNAMSYDLVILDNGDAALYDTSTGKYVNTEEYHKENGYTFMDEFGLYAKVYDNGEFDICECPICNYWMESPGDDYLGETPADPETVTTAATVRVLIDGEVLSGNYSGDGWSYDTATNTLTLNNYRYEGLGLIPENYESFNAADSEDPEGGFDEDAWFSLLRKEADNIKGVIYSEGPLTVNLSGSNYITITEKGSDASYALNVKGELSIEGDGTLTVKSGKEEKVYSSDPAEAVSSPVSADTTDTNIDDDTEFPSDYADDIDFDDEDFPSEDEDIIESDDTDIPSDDEDSNTADDTDIPSEDEDINESDDTDIPSDDEDSNTTDDTDIPSENEDVTPTDDTDISSGNEDITQNNNEGDVSVNNNIGTPDISNSFGLPGINNNITLDPSVNIGLPHTNVEQIVLDGMQVRYPQITGRTGSKPSATRVSSVPSGAASVAEKDETFSSKVPVVHTADNHTGEVSGTAPKTADPNTVGLLTALISTVIGGIAALVILIRKRRLGQF